jgi:hypothetical protein
LRLYFMHYLHAFCPSIWLEKTFCDNKICCNHIPISSFSFYSQDMESDNQILVNKTRLRLRQEKLMFKSILHV